MLCRTMLTVSQMSRSRSAATTTHTAVCRQVTTPDNYDICLATAVDSPTASVTSPLTIRSIPSVPSSLDLSSDVTATSSILDNSASNQHAQPDCNNFSGHLSNYTWFPFSCKVARFMFPTVLLANVRGSLCTKNDELSVSFSNNSVDIACLTETWLNDGIIDDLIHIPGYSVHIRDRQDGRQGGGVAVYVKQGIPCSLLSQLNHASLEVMWLLFRQKLVPREVSHLMIGVVYYPPKANNTEMMGCLIGILDTVNRDHPNLGILLCSDYSQLS